MSPALRRVLLVLPACLALLACPENLTELDRLKTLLEARRYDEIAGRPVPCTAANEACAEAQEIRAEACRNVGRPDCAMLAYRAAAEARGQAAPRKLLLNLAAAANDTRGVEGSDKAAATEAELLAAGGLLRPNPADPEGCYHAGAARLAQALQGPPGPGVCAALAAVPATCAQAPAPEGRERQARQLATQLTAQRRAGGCA